MPSDLNLKKSWNPNLMKNRERVWQREQEVLQQFRNKKNREQKLDEIKTKNELLSLNPNFKNDSESKISWMYKGPDNTDHANNDANEDFLLGKRRLTDLVADNNSKHLNKNKPQPYSRMDKVINSNSLQESSQDFTEKKDSKLDKNDPMYTIKLQERKRQEIIEKQKQLKEFKVKQNAKHKLNDHRNKNNHHSGHRHHHRHRSGSKISELDKQHFSTSSRDHDPLRSKHDYRDRS